MLHRPITYSYEKSILIPRWICRKNVCASFSSSFLFIYLNIFCCLLRILYYRFNILCVNIMCIQTSYNIVTEYLRFHFSITTEMCGKAEKLKENFFWDILNKFHFIYTYKLLHIRKQNCRKKRIVQIDTETIWHFGIILFVSGE